MNKFRSFLRKLYIKYILCRDVLTRDQEIEISNDLFEDDRAMTWAFGHDCHDEIGKECADYWNANHDDLFILKETPSYSDMARIYLAYKELYK